MILLLLATLSASLMAEVGQVRDTSIANFDLVIQRDPDEVVVNTDLMRRAAAGGANSSSNLNYNLTRNWALPSGPALLSPHDVNVSKAFASAGCPLAEYTNAAANASSIRSYCSYITGDVSACNGTGTTAQQKCQVDCVIKESHQQQIQSDLSSLPAPQKLQACIDRVNNVVSNSTSVSPHPDRIRSELMLTRAGLGQAINTRRNARRARLIEGASIGCDGSGSLNNCDNFTNTAVSNSSISSLASLFSTEYTTNRSGFLGIGTRKDCDYCMKSKYQATTSVSGIQGGESFDQRLSALKEQRIIEIAARKANEALSNHLKFLERNDFMSRFSEVPKEKCDSFPQLNSLPRSCKYSRKILDKIKSGFTNIAGGSAQQTIQEILSKSSTAMFERKSSCDGSFDFDSYQRSRLTQVGAGEVDPQFWIDSEAEAKIQRCGDQDAGCFARAMAECYNKKIPSVSVDDAHSTLVSHMAMSPFLRTMMASKVGVLAYKNMSIVALNGTDSVEQFMHRNREKIWEAASLDSQQSCRNIEQDLKLALCSTEDNLAENYTADELRTELATLINDEAESRVVPGLYLHLGATCALLRDSESHLSNTTPQVASMLSPDRIVAAIPISQQPIAGFDGAIDVFSEVSAAVCAASRTPAPSLFPAPSAPLSMTGQVKTCKNYYEQISLSNAHLPFCSTSSSTGGAFFDFNTLNLQNPSSYIYTTFPSRGNFTQSGFGGTGTKPFSLGDQSIYSTGSSDSDVVVTGKLPDNGVTEQGSSHLIQGSRSQDQTSTIELGASNVKQGFELGSVETSEMVSTSAATAFASMTGTPNSFIQPAPQMRGATSNFTNAFQSQVQMPQQIEVANTVSGATVRREEALVRQESELLRRVDTQSIENRELREAVTQLRREMSTMASQNAQLLPTLQSMMKSRGAKIGPESEEEQEEESEPAVAEVAPTTSSPRARGRSPASVPSSRNLERSGGQAQGGSEGNARTQGPTINPVGQSGGVNIVQDSRGPQVIGGAAGAGANITVSAGGARAGGGMERLVTRFSPSSPVTRQALAAPGGAVAEVGAEEKTQLVMEFLDYVKDFPLYRNGAYLSQSNDAITVDYGGKEVVVRLDQITNPQARSLVQERIITQRMNLNQQLRQARLTELRRLLAEASDGL